MKRIPAFLLAVIILASSQVFGWQPRHELSAYAESDLEETEPISELEEEDIDEDDADPDLPTLAYADDELVVGTTMPMYGTFFTSMWGNGSSDRDVRNLIHGYNLVEWDSDHGESILNPAVVWDCEITENEVGDHIYTFTLNDDLQYCDGSPITVWDYAFSFLLRMDPEIAKLGGTPEVLKYLEGYDAYISDRTAYIEEMGKNGWDAGSEDDRCRKFKSDQQHKGNQSLHRLISLSGNEYRNAAPAALPGIYDGVDGGARWHRRPGREP